MTKLSRKELRRELKEFIIPVMEHIRTLVTTGKADQVLEFDHRGNKTQAQFHPTEQGMTVYVMYWYCETIAFKLTSQQLGNIVDADIDQLAKQFVDSNEHVIGVVYRGAGKGH